MLSTRLGLGVAVSAGLLALAACQGSDVPDVTVSCNSPEAAYRGAVAGQMWDNTIDRSLPFNRRACFASVPACQIWHNQMLTIMQGGRLTIASCDPL